MAEREGGFGGSFGNSSQMCWSLQRPLRAWREVPGSSHDTYFGGMLLPALFQQGMDVKSAGRHPVGWRTCPCRFPLVGAKNTPHRTSVSSWGCRSGINCEWFEPWDDKSPLASCRAAGIHDINSQRKDYFNRALYFFVKNGDASDYKKREGV